MNTENIKLYSIEKNSKTYYFEKKLINNKSVVTVTKILLEQNSIYTITTTAGYYVTNGINSGKSGNFYYLYKTDTSSNNVKIEKVENYAFSDVPAVDFWITNNTLELSLCISGSSSDLISFSGIINFVKH